MVVLSCGKCDEDYCAGCVDDCSTVRTLRPMGLVAAKAAAAIPRPSNDFDSYREGEYSQMTHDIGRTRFFQQAFLEFWAHERVRHNVHVFEIGPGLHCILGKLLLTENGKAVTGGLTGTRPQCYGKIRYTAFEANTHAWATLACVVKSIRDFKLHVDPPQLEFVTEGKITDKQCLALRKLPDPTVVISELVGVFASSESAPQVLALYVNNMQLKTIPVFIPNRFTTKVVPLHMGQQRCSEFLVRHFPFHEYSCMDSACGAIVEDYDCMESLERPSAAGHYRLNFGDDNGDTLTIDARLALQPGAIIDAIGFYIVIGEKEADQTVHTTSRAFGRLPPRNSKGTLSKGWKNMIVTIDPPLHAAADNVLIVKTVTCGLQTGSCCYEISLTCGSDCRTVPIDYDRISRLFTDA